MPDRLDKALFLIGLTLFTIGQVALNILGPASQDQSPIDYAHWLLLTGSVSLIPLAARLPRRGFHLISGPVLLIGIVCIIGMNAIDFVYWTLPHELDMELYRHLVAQPSVWQPFMRFGPNELFITGLLLPSLGFVRISQRVTLIASGLVISGLATMIVGTQWFNVIGYGLVIAGYGLHFYRTPNSGQA